MRNTAKIAPSSPDPSQPQQSSIFTDTRQSGAVPLSFFSRRAFYAMSIFIALSVLVGFNATHGIDQWIFALANPVVSEPLDFAASLVTLLGNIEVTGALTLAVSMLGWKRRGIRGFAPMLLFLGVTIELVLKFFLPHPSLPEGYARNVEFLPPLRFPTPYSFPSGHMLRITFLAVYFTANGGPWRVTGWMLVLAMGLTRLYLNEHWTSDILGGVFLGLALAHVARTIAGRDIPYQP